MLVYLAYSVNLFVPKFLVFLPALAQVLFLHKKDVDLTEDVFLAEAGHRRNGRRQRGQFNRVSGILATSAGQKWPLVINEIRWLTQKRTVLPVSAFSDVSPGLLRDAFPA